MTCNVARGFGRFGLQMNARPRELVGQVYKSSAGGRSESDPHQGALADSELEYDSDRRQALLNGQLDSLLASSLSSSALNKVCTAS